MVAHLVRRTTHATNFYLGNTRSSRSGISLPALRVGDVTVFGARDYSMRIWLDRKGSLA